MRVCRLVSLLFLLPAAAQAQTALCDRLRLITQEPAVSSAHWGVSVLAPDGTALCGIAEAQLFRPASNNKLFTTAAAFALRGPSSTVETRVTGRLDPATGVVAGDLTLVGAGDANLDSGDLPYLPPAQRPPASPFAFHDLEDLARQLRAAGVKTVSGDVVGSDALAPYEPYPPSWNADDLPWGYGAPVSELSIADNELRLLVTPGAAAGAPAAVTLDQHGVPFYTLEAEVRTVAKGEAAGVQVERVSGSSRTLRVYGSVALGAADAEEVAIDDPALYAAMALRGVLAAQGIAVTGTARAVHQPMRSGTGFLAELHRYDCPRTGPDVACGEPQFSCTQPALAPVLATHVSPTLLQDATFTQKTSQNLHAELILRSLARCGQPAGVDGARRVRAFLLRAGVADGDFVLYDGSGLSDHDLATPRAFTTLLRYAGAQPWFAAWKTTLPVGGVDGSLASRFAGPLTGRIVAKTGTLGESRALSGYAGTASGRTLMFSILVDDHLPGSTADRSAMDRMVEQIAAEP